jgi:hypothetical protein
MITDYYRHCMAGRPKGGFRYRTLVISHPTFIQSLRAQCHLRAFERREEYPTVIPFRIRPPTLQSTTTRVSLSLWSRPTRLGFVIFKPMTLMSLSVTVIDEKYRSAWKSFKRWRTKRKTALSCGILVAASTLFINLCATIYIPLHSAPTTGLQQPLNPRLFIGDCSQASKINTYVHFVVNALSSLILLTSNMFMQLLLAPTRKQIDIAHAKRRSVDIGIFSLGNFFVVSKRNRFIWVCLAITSLPLHLL